tara:strand:+ start:17324 stop:17518 length:195 start_codon:yes stop_codon:yes gene_type:complete
VNAFEQLLGRLRLRANQTGDEDLRQAVALLLDMQQQLAEVAAERDRAQCAANRLRAELPRRTAQ